MPKVALTERWLRAVQVAQRTDFFDTSLPTFGVRIATTGHKAWFVLYSLRGERRKRRLRLGTYPAIPLADARRDALAAIASVVRGEDPKLASEVGGVAFGELARLYLERASKPNKRSWKRDEQAVHHDLLPAWEHKSAGAIRRKEVAALLDGIMDRGAPMQANYVRSVLSCIYRFGMARELVDFNPVSGTERPHDPEPRDRVLSEAEIVQLWRHTAGLHASIRDALRGILLTGQRPGEVAGLVRSEVGEGAWTIPVARAKRKREHIVPLVGMFAEVVAMAGDPVLFPSAHYKRRGLPISREALSYSLLHFRRKAGWQQDATPHDLRRTAATGMAQCGVSQHIIGRVLGHTDSSITAVYNRWQYFGEKKDALERWDAHLRRLLSSQT